MHPKSSPEGRRCFYPRARGGRDWNVRWITTRRCGFYPRARGGRDLELLNYRPLFEQVSIHAPAEGATPVIIMPPILNLFLSTRPRRARQDAHGFQRRHGVFLSTRPRRARPLFRQIVFNISKFLSTRPRRARLSRAGSVTRAAVAFLSTRPRGARPTSCIVSSLSHRFLSTRPRGARPFFLLCFIRFIGFYPRARGGRDVGRVYPDLDVAVSIHAPAGGRDLFFATYMGTAPTFLSTRPRGGATPSVPPLRLRPQSFLSTRPRGGATLKHVKYGAKRKFLSTRPRGGATTPSLTRALG